MCNNTSDPADALADFFSDLAATIRTGSLSDPKLQLLHRLQLAYLFDELTTGGVIYTEKEYEKFLMTGWFIHTTADIN
jgi:hypothetical protein